MPEKETLAPGRAVSSRSADTTLAEVFELSYRRLVVQMYGVVGNFGEAEDLVQEAFVRASAARGRFRRVDNPEAWLRRTAINLHRNRWRKLRNYNRVRPRLEVSPPDLPGLEEHVTVIAVAPPAPQQPSRGARAALPRGPAGAGGLRAARGSPRAP